MPFINDKIKSYQTEQERNNELPNPSPAERRLKPKTRFTFRPQFIKEKLHTQIFGQDEVIERISNMIDVIYVDITEKDRPLYVVLFLGPTGVGKTETVRIVAEAIHGEKEAFSRIDMNTLAQEHYAAAVIGAPPGYVGSKEGNTVFKEELIKGSFSKPGIVLFDEIEKADASVTQSLLNVFDNGKMVLTNGEKEIDFRNSIIFMTSNLGSQQIFEFLDINIKAKFKRFYYRLFPSNWRKRDKGILNNMVKKQMEKHFSPEFLNRIDDTIMFNWLGDETFEPIIDKHIKDLNIRLKKHLCTVTLSKDAKQLLYNKGFDQHYGARSMRRTIRTHLEVPLAKLLAGREKEKTSVVYSIQSKGEEFEFFKEE
ncbi:AAA family ATPase [Alteribacillus sp. JSM 102045]|uniref:AAA family ATPase n=1 Tax=Alteribacillus sp. JSM 102045 TaxID=1562101 RepID=UPI0035C20B80